jgi:DNA-binding transcriptional LysR family regulator
MLEAGSALRTVLTHRQVEAFRAVMLTGGVTSAAEMLRIAQPAVTRLIRDMQTATRLKLFERKGSRLFPTSEANSLYMEVERSFVGLDRILQTAQDLELRRVGTLRIACLPALANGYLPRFMTGFLAKRPDIRITLLGMPTVNVLDWIVSGQSDVGFAELPVDHPLVHKEPLPSVPVVAAVPSGHELARKSRLTPIDLVGQPFVGFTTATILSDRIGRVFAEAGVKPIQRVETPLSLIACAFVAAGLGIALVDPFTGQGFAGRGVRLRPFAPRIDVEFSAVYSTQHEPSGLARDLIDTLHADIFKFATDCLDTSRQVEA